MARENDIQKKLSGAFNHFVWKGQVRPIHDLNEAQKKDVVASFFEKFFNYMDR